MPNVTIDSSSNTAQLAAVISAGMELVRTLVADGKYVEGDEGFATFVSLMYLTGPGYEHEAEIGMDLPDLAEAAELAGVAAEFEQNFGHLLPEPVAV